MHNLDFDIDGKRLNTCFQAEPRSLAEACAVAVYALHGIRDFGLESVIRVASTDDFSGGSMTVERALRWVQREGSTRLHEPSLNLPLQRIARDMLLA